MGGDGGAAELTAAVREALAELAGEVAAEAGIEAGEILEITLVGNPIMHHLVLGLNPVADNARLRPRIGVMLQGGIAAYDLFCMLLERDGYVQLVYKHAVSTIQPATPLDLSGDWEGEED